MGFWFILKIFVASVLSVSPTGKFNYENFHHREDSGYPGHGRNSFAPTLGASIITDVGAVAGSQGRNIAVSGDTVVIIYSQSSGNTLYGVQVAYSFNGGGNWHSYDLSTIQMVDCYSGVVWPRSWNSPLFFWNEAVTVGGAELTSRVLIAWDVNFPNGVFQVIELPHSSDWNVWLPSADASGDTIIVTGTDVLTTFFSFIWRSYDHGASWDADTFLTTGIAGGWHDPPIPRIGHNGYVAVLTDWIVEYWCWISITPFFLESLDGGQTWIDTINLWDASGFAPYDSCSIWWGCYDFVLDNNNRPHIALRLAKLSFPYGDAWYVSPGSGSPGAWEDWEMTLMVGEGNGAPYSAEPTITYDPFRNVLFFGYRGLFEIDVDTVVDLGYFSSTDLGCTWNYEGPFKEIDELTEMAFEFPVLASSHIASSQLYACYVEDETGDFYIASVTPDVSAREYAGTKTGNHLLRIISPATNWARIIFNLEKREEATLEFYDVSGKLVKSFDLGALLPGHHEREISLSDLKSGVYLVRLQGKTTSAIQKLVVAK